MSIGAGKAEEAASTWIDLLQARAAERPEARAYTFLADGEEEAGSLTYAGLDARARAIGARLQQLGLAGERALLLYQPGLDFIAAFLGCLYAGVVAVPAYPPRSARTLPRLRAIAMDARPAVALTTSDLLANAEALGSRMPELAGARWVATDLLDVPGLSGEWREPRIDGDTLAFLQYTSGSTALPKGVMVSHGNLLHNEQMIQAAFRQSESSVIAGWLPLYHDMGLIGNVLQPLYVGAPCILMSPVAFLQRPLRWLRAISRYRATTSGGPNFAYDLCAKRISPAERHGLDLSCWEVAFNGAEPVRPDTLERFAEAFGPFGFRREAFYPCYGLAEATLFVSGGVAGEPAVVSSFRAADLERDRVVATEPLDPEGRWLVGCGGAWAGQEIAIVDPETGRRCPPDQVGEIWVSGPSVAKGYWRRDEESERTFGARLADDPEGLEGTFLRTGDLGFLSEGSLYVTGRLKDLIILRGRNLYPQDLELTAERSHGALRPGCGAAFSVDLGGEERLVIVFELERRREAEAAEAAEALRRAVAEEHEAQVHDVVLVRMGSVPKTSSGKIQRHACRAGYLAGGLEMVGHSALSLEEAETAAPTEMGRDLLASLAPAERRAALESWLRAEVGRSLGLPSSRIDPARPLTSFGLDSLGAVEVKSRVESALAVPVSLGALLEGVSLAGLAVDVLERLAEGLALESAPALLSDGAETGEFPLSYGQRGLWYLHRLAPESLAYHLAGAGQVRGVLDADALVRAFQALTLRHPALRTTFSETPRGPVQRVHAALAPEVVLVDLAAGEDLEDRLKAEVWRPFDLERGPLVRLGVLRPAAGDPVLFLAIHHMVCDFGSLAVMARDLGSLYAQETGRPVSPLAPVALRYTDFVRWQEEWLAGAQGERLWNYWRETLAPGGATAPYLDLPSDRPRPAVQTWAGDARVFRLGSGLAADLQTQARKRGATLYMALLAAFEAILARYTGQSDLLIGSPTTGRSSGAAGDLVGYFVNPVALRVSLSGEPTFLSLLDEVQRVVVGAFQHQEFPFALLAERLQPQRDPSRPPLLDVLFTFQKAHGTGADLGGFALGSAGARLALGPVQVESLPLATVAAPYSLDFMVAEVEEGLGALLRFNADLFDGATMERLSGHYQTLLAGALADPGASLWELPLLTSEESRQLLRRPEGPDWPGDVLLHELFEAQARRTPDAVALIGGTERLTYRELDEQAEGVARRLRALGVGPETRVGVFLLRTPRLLISMLGILKAGGAYVPLDPAYPRERVEAILEDAQAPVVITEGALLDTLPAVQARILRADEEGPSGLPDLASLPVRTGRLAYLIYTSGSTGRPKGVAIEHRSASALMHWARDSFRPEELRGVLASTSISFDMSVFELFAPLAWGGTVILAENALSLPHLPAREEVTLIDTVPSAMAELLRQGAVPASVRTVNLGGEPLRGMLARGVHALGTVERLLNLYGPSEDTTFSTVAEVRAEGEPTIGRILANSHGYVLDWNLRLMPSGIPGELYLGGVGLSRGYLGRPDLTAERYIPDPFSEVPGERLYKTGDLARWRPDGELEYLGRLDHQVKIRGFRVELGEIEAALLAHPALQDAAVLALGEGGDRRLVAYVVGEAAELRSYLKEKLPEYMVPSAFVSLEALPLTPNGKVDRRVLAKIELDRVVEAGTYLAPRTPAEERLAGLWAEVLGIERVGVQDDFFDLGGHSLLATQLVSRVRETFGVELPLRRLFEVSTVESLSAELEGLGAALAPPLRPVDRDGDLPLSFAQERMWVLNRLEPESPLYNIPGGLRLRGRLDIDALRGALGEIVRRHEALRTTFAVRDGRPVQVVAPALDLPVPLEEADESGLHHRAAEEARKPFDLATGPVMRARLLRLGEQEHVLLVTFHHIVADGWSIGVVLQELAALYTAFVEGRPSPLPDLAIQYADFAVWQRGWLSGESLAARIAWWRERLAGAPTQLEVPADRPRPPQPSHRGATRHSTLPAPVGQAVRDLAQQRGATSFMVLLAALGTLLRRYTGQEDILLGSPVASRDQIETEGLIGFFVNTLVLRVDLTGDPGFETLLDRVREMALGAYSHQDLPFEKLVEELAPQRDPSRTPLFQVLLALQNAPAALPDLPGLEADLLETDPGVARFELTLFARETADGIEAALEHALDLFDSATADRMLGHFERLLSGAVADPERKVSELPLLTDQESRQLLEIPKGPEWPEDVLLHEFFETQARRTPDAVALIGGSERLTYRELNERADGVAIRLRALGVGAETRVGVFLQRTPRLLISLLGILKAGGAYVPLDPAYPRERVEAILEDAEAPVVITEGALLEALPSVQAQIVRADEEGASDPPELEPLPVRMGRLAYVIYTSGSTGRPKGVAIEHRSVSALMHWSRESFRPEELRGVLASTSICFDMSVFELFAPLAWGGTVILAENALALPHLPAKDEVTLIDTVPSAMAELLRQGAVPASVRTVNLGGEPLRGALARGVHALGTVRRLLNLYGPSEDTTFSTVAEVGAQGEPTIGRILANSHGYVLDRNLRLMPVGVPGELHLGGVGISRGYLGRPELTAERYIPDPFSDTPGERLYKTGDLIRWLPSGELEYLGRLDHQVKVRGFRVELGEIEAALLAHPALQDAAVLALGEGGERHLVAYVVGEASELRSYLKEKLPEYMVPSAFVTLEALPLTPNGKIDRRALAKIEPGRGVETESYLAPRTPTEERLAGLWTEVLGIEQIGVQDDFFDLGGHSLLATQLVSRVRETFGVELPLRRLFEVSTVESLAAELEGFGAAVAPPLLPVDRGGDLPLSFAQERLWFLDRLEPGNPVYNLPVAARLVGRLDTAALSAALNEILRRHEAVRTVFSEMDGRPVQRVAPWQPFDLPVTEVAASRVEALLREEARTPFDLGSGKLARAFLLRLNEEEHVLALTFHHIAADGWSIGVFLRELSDLYTALAAGQPSPLPELAIQYGDFAVWQRDWLRGAVLEGQLAYWRDVLAGLPPALDLPTDRPRPAVRSTRGAHLPVVIPGDLAASLNGLAQNWEATPFMVLLAGLQVLLSRLSGQEDLAVGSVVANRNHMEIEPLIGFFVNTVVLRGELGGDPPFLDFLRRTRAAALGAYAHQDVPFEKLVEDLAPQRDAGRTPLFQVSLALQNTAPPPLELPGLRAEPLDIDSGGSRFDLTLLLRDSGYGFAGSMEYALALFDAATVHRLLRSYHTLLEGIAADPSRPVSELPLLTPEEGRQILAEASQDRVDWPGNVLLHEFFESQARRTPDAVALIAGTERLTYRELDERATLMARRLQALGVGAETRVGVFLQRTPRLLVSMLGILKAGGAYVPLDPAYPRERVEAILGDAEAPVVITEGSLLEILPAVQARIVRADEEGPSGLPELEPLPVRLGRLAYVIYTSGSTGLPKGVAIEHRSAAALMHWSRESFRPEELRGVLASTSICFDMSVFELFAPLAWGGTVILAENALALPHLPARDEVTLIDTVPSAMAELLRQGAVPASVRTVNLGGEPLRGVLAQGVHALGTVERLLNLYGPSEDTTFSTIADVGAEGEPTIGRVLANSQGYVLDRHLRLVPVGAPGELYLGGVGLSRGYLGRPDLTAERYIPDPFSAIPGGRLYKTGDLVRLRSDRELEYLGRLDHQVKVRGFRVELGEIEAALLAHPALQDAAVLAIGEGGDRRLVAYVVSQQAAPDFSELRSYLKEKLPEYMVPTAVVALDALPLTPNGKIDRRALALIEPERAAEAEGYVAPRTPVEERLAEIWAEVLGLERVGVEDDFFDLGGHSLLATQLVSRVREAFGVELPLRRLFEVSTVESLAVELESLGAVVEIPLRPVDRSGDLPLSFAQERLWFLDRLEPGNPVYNMPAAMRLVGHLDVPALATALGEIVRRHEALRTVFAEAEGRPVQRIAPWTPFHLPVAEVSREEVGALLREEARTPFDLASGKLVRARLLHLGENEHILALTLHHIAADGWSVGVVLRELSALYNAFLARRSSPLPELAIQYGDFSVWQRQWLQGQVLEEQLAYWREALAGLPPALDLPTDRPRPAVRGSEGAYLPMSLREDMARSVRALAQTHDATPFMVLLAGLQALLGRMSGQDDLAVGSVVANRNRLEVEPLIGFFVNTLVLRGQLGGDPAFSDLLARTRTAALGAYAHQDVPFEKLVEELAPQRDPGRTPLFQVSLALQNAPAVPLELPDLKAEPLATDAGGARFDLTFLLRDSGDGFEGAVEYAVDLFDATTVERLLRHYGTLLEGMVADPGRPISELPLLTPAEARQLLAEASLDRADWPEDLLLHEFFEAQVRRTPDAVALIGGTERLTYRELEERASSMARRLRALDVGAETRVGVFLRRTPLLLISMLGILKAGGAYVPLDPAYPRERVEAILADAQAPVVITEGALLDLLPSVRAEIFRADEEDPAGLPELDPLPARMERLAYVIYTSGSTGRPKGVAIEHRSASALMHWSRESFRPEELRGVLASTSICFDMSVFELFAPLAWGGTVILAENALALPHLPAKDEVTLIDTVPSAMAELLRQQALPASVRTVNLGGEPLRGVLARGVHALGTVERLLNLYGPSEDTTFSTVAEVGAEGEPTIGRVLTNSHGYVLDRHLRLVPVGAPGELYLGGIGLSRGYLGRPDLTAERYIPDPFSEAPGERLYRTGDLVRLRPDGELEYLGRLDQQVKVRGFRVELGEIEAALLAHPALQDAAVLALGEGGDRRLVAYVVAQAEAPDFAEIRGYLKEKLPEYMVPTAMVVLEALPLTPNGKIDRRALGSIEPSGTVEVEGYVSPRTPVESRLAEIWAEVLGLERVGIEDDFFDLGGHSLLATQLVSRLRGTFGVELPLRRLFEVPTVAGLAAELEGLGVAVASPLRPVDSSGDLPLSFAQERLWFLDRLEPGSSLYHMPAAMRLIGNLDVDGLAFALGEIVRRHQALRTVFAEVGGRPVQRIASWEPFDLPVMEVAAADLERLVQEEARTPFDLGAGKLVRARLFRLGADEHVIALTFHHIAADGWSVGVFLRELSALYGAAVEGRSSHLPELASQYADFSVWQREWLQGEVLESQLAYWREVLAGLPPALDLPTDRPRPAVRSSRGASLPVSLSGNVAESVRALAQRADATPFMVLLAGFHVLLSRMSGQEDVAVGSAVANRNRLEIEPLIGFFVNTLVLRGQLGDDPAFLQFLERTRATALGAFGHQDVPFEKLVEELAPQRDPGRTPLFQVALALQNAAMSAPPALPGLKTEALAVDAGGARFDLTLLLSETADGFEGAVEYAADLFDAATVNRLLRHYRTLLEGIAADPGRPVSELPLLTLEEGRQILAEAARDRADWPGDVLLHEFFEAQARRTPDAVAVIGGTERLTYRELDEHAGRMARWLRNLGVGAETPVGVFLQRTPRMLASMLGVLKAGGAYVPLDPAYPRERVEAILSDAQAPMVITEAALVESLPSVKAEIVKVEEAPADLPELEPLPVRIGRLAYVIYTSGSTGRPKGVAIEHRSVSALMHWCRQAFRPEELRGVLASTSICFDMSVFELFAPLAWGGTVILAENALALPHLAAKDEVTLIDTVPSAMTELLRQGAVPASVRTVTLGGEPLRGMLAGEVHALGTVERLLNLYGPSEDTTFSTIAEVGAEGEPTIGRVLTNGHGYVLDRHLRLVPLGAPGELYLGGAGISRGYLGRPDLTAERYIPHPYSEIPGERLYKTGDLVRLRPDGELEYLGRLDRQVKVRGFRVELGEIEAALLAHPAVQDAAVLAPGEGGDRRLVAYVAGDASELRTYLKEKLPEYMVPSAFVALDSLPLTPNGKIDRRALAKIEPERALEAEGYAAPRTPAEERLAAIWAELLGLERVGIEDDFFELGGHSLLVAQLVSRVRESFGVELPLRRLFEVSTIVGLAQELRGLGVSGAPPLERLPEADEYPLSFSQERLWILDRFEPGNPAYNMPGGVRLRGGLDVAALERSLDSLLERHESLRTVFAGRDGRAFQRIVPASPRSLPMVDLRALAGAEKNGEARRLASEQALRPFDLGEGPLFRALLVQETEAEHLLLLNMHHIVSDGWSMNVLVRELAAFYTAQREGRAAGLAELPLRYVDYVAWQRLWLSGAERESQLAYWRERLAGIPQALELPTDRPRPAVRSYKGGHVSRWISGGVTDSLNALARQEGASIFMVLLAAFKVLLQRLSGEEDIVVGSPIAGRSRGELEGLVGMFLNTLVLRTFVGGDPTIRELLGQVREAALEAYAHQDVPFEMLLDELKPERDLSRTPLFQVFFNMLNLPAGEMRLPGLTLESLPDPDLPSKFDLTLYVQPLPDGLRFDMAYNGDLFDAERIEGMLEQLDGILARFAEAPETRIRSLSLLTPAALAVLPDPREPLSDEWRGAVHEKLTFHARREPGRLALRDRQGAWTYGELEARSNRLAHQLVAAGLQPEDPVAVYAHRGATLVWAVLGALKAGGAFVMLDPAYPPARLIEMLKLASPRAFLALAEAGPLAAELEELVASLPGCVRLDLAPASPEERILEGEASAPPAVTVGPDHRAVIGFTSGSTGLPKGIEGRHGPLSHFLPWQVETFGLRADDRFSMLSGLSHDPLQRDIFTPLWLGASLAIPDPLDMGTPGRLAEWMRREEVSVSHLTPAMAQILTERPPGAPEVELPPMRFVLLVGDVLTRRDVVRLRRLAPRVTVVNLYGSTETQRAVAYHVVPEEGSGLAREVLPLGKGMRDVQLLVLNAAGTLAGIGEVGEICVRSPHLARGYLGDEALTAAKFQPNPFTGQAADRIYRTGDLGRYLPDGSVTFVSRADQQVKIRGFRIEPGEIEAQLGRLPGVREAIVLPRGEGAGDKRLVAYVTGDPAAGEVPAVARMRSYLKERLPAYMVPSGFVVLDRLPVTPNGKVDRKALLRIDDRHRETDVDYTAPQTEAELTIASILQDVLKIERVGVDDNFFDLGGNSLLLVQVHGRLQEHFSREILLVEIFNNPTVRALAAHLEGEKATAASSKTSGDRAEQLRQGRDRLRRRFQQQKG